MRVHASRLCMILPATTHINLRKIVYVSVCNRVPTPFRPCCHTRSSTTRACDTPRNYPCQCPQNDFRNITQITFCMQCCEFTHRTRYSPQLPASVPVYRVQMRIISTPTSDLGPWDNSSPQPRVETTPPQKSPAHQHNLRRSIVV